MAKSFLVVVQPYEEEEATLLFKDDCCNLGGVIRDKDNQSLRKSG